MIKLYSENKLYVETRDYHTFPLIQLLNDEHSVLNDHFRFVGDLEACDFAIIPTSIQILFYHKKKREVDQFIKNCSKNGKK